MTTPGSITPLPTSRILYDVEGAAALLGVNESLIYREIHAGNLAALRIGLKLVRIPHDAIEAYIQARLAEFKPLEGEEDGPHLPVSPSRATR